jgi:hypothetical protein
MTKTKTAVAATLALGVATLLLSPTARAMPVDGLATATASVADGRDSTVSVRAPSTASVIGAGAGEVAIQCGRHAAQKC